MKILKIFPISILSVFIFLLSGCHFATTSIVAQNVSLGMTQEMVVRNSGRPFSKNIYRDPSGNLVEEWSYKETTWDDAGWSWDKTIINTVVIFENNEVISVGNAGERFKTRNPMSPSVNIDATVHCN